MISPGRTRARPDAFVRVYDSSGALAWQDQFGTAGADVAYGVVVGTEGNVAVVGYTTGDRAGPPYGGGDAFIRVYDASDGVLWQDQFGTGSQDVAWDVAVDALGRFVVVDDTRASLFQAATGERDGFVRVYDLAGSVVWQRQFGSVRSDTFRGATVDGEGHVTLVGGAGGNQTESAGLVSSYVYVRMYDAQGSFVWQELIDGTGSGTDLAAAAVVDGLGRLALAGNVTRDLFGLGAATGSSDAFVRVYERPGGVVLSAPR